MSIETSLQACAAALASRNGPDGMYRTVQTELAALVGHRLFTLLVLAPGGREVERIWTSDPAAYPLQGRKAMGITPWGAEVLVAQHSWMCSEVAGIRWAFPDHELIESLGLGACLSIPVVAFGTTLGTVNILDAPGCYNGADLATAGLVAPLLAYPMAQAAARLSATPASL